MCIIIDKSVIGVFLSEKAEHRRNSDPIRNWLEKGGGQIVYGGRNAEELESSARMRKYIVESGRRGRAKLIAKKSVDDDEATVAGLPELQSDDPHVLALARVSGARLLFAEDHDLEVDFRNTRIVHRPKGRVYKKFPEHKHLLKPCPRCPGKPVKHRKKR